MSDLVKLDERYGLYINGEWSDGSKGNTMTSFSPATGEKLADFIDATAEDVDFCGKSCDGSAERMAQCSSD